MCHVIICIVCCFGPLLYHGVLRWGADSADIVLSSCLAIYLPAFIFYPSISSLSTAAQAVAGLFCSHLGVCKLQVGNLLQSWLISGQNDNRQTKKCWWIMYSLS